MKKILFLLFVIFFAISLISATSSLGIFKKGSCINLLQTCANCTYNNVSVFYPNSTEGLTESVMTKKGTRYNYTFCNTNVLGIYSVYGHGNVDGIDTVWAYDFEVTGTGFEFNQSKMFFYVAMIIILGFLFALTLFSSARLPSGNNTNGMGMIISVNHLKYLRPVLYCVAWALLVAIMFVSSNIAIAYIGESMIGVLLFTIYRIMFWLTIPFIFIIFIYTFVKIFDDKEVKRMLERGIDIGGSSV